MRYPKEKDTIIDRLRTIAKERDTFTVGDCIRRFGSGQHNSNDWVKCADELTAKGELLKTGNYHEYKVVKKEETMENKVYKALMEVDGRLESVIAGLGRFTEYTPLTYKEGEITYAPKDSIGIFVYNDQAGAKSLLRCNAGYTSRGRRVICEATPLGKRIPYDSKEIFGDRLRYPAILLGKEVWREKSTEQTRLEEVQKDLGGNISTVFRLGLRLSPYSIYWNKDRYVVYKSSKGIVYTCTSVVDTVRTVKRDVERDRKPKEEPKFEVGDKVRFKAKVTKPSLCVTARMLGKIGIYEGQSSAGNADVSFEATHGIRHCCPEELEPALPKEEWVDVTKECELALNKCFINKGYAVGVRHNGKLVISIGAIAWDESCVKDGRYRVEYDKAACQGSFKILKKVV